MSKLASILVVDDEPIMQEILGDFLREEGYSIDIAGSGEEGVDLAQKSSYDCAIVDLMMPGIDGIETMQKLRDIDAGHYGDSFRLSGICCRSHETGCL